MDNENALTTDLPSIGAIFKEHPMGSGDWGQKFYDNGYGISVVRNEYTYGGDEGLFEIAVLHGNKEESDLCYLTPITSDVIGYLTKEEVEVKAKEIEALPPTNANECAHSLYILNFIDKEIERYAKLNGVKKILKLLALYRDESATDNERANAGLKALRAFEKRAGYTPKKKFPTYEDMLK